MTTNKPRIDVAVAVVFGPDGKVLWGCRPEGKPYAGYWEFPGGKVEPGETVWQALVRELREELNITALEGGPWFVIEHDYEHANVRLHLYRVWHHSGQAEALEGQVFAWDSLEPRGLNPILPATEPLLPKLAQPQTMWITHYGASLQGFARQLVQRLEAAPPRTLYVQFREKELLGEDLRWAFQHCVSLCNKHNQPLLINSDVLAALEALVGPQELAPHAVHLTERHLMQGVREGARERAVGASVHSMDGLVAAHERGLKYAVLGAVQATASHPGQTGMGWLAFRALAERAQLPVFAVGGLRPQDRQIAMRNGAHGLAMIRGSVIDCTGES
ncbi:MAG TPA: Nudix family hydrolase [Limnobacter sp.]|nr:Nudix family hydrolase [Limnobacter sp.]